MAQDNNDQSPPLDVAVLQRDYDRYCARHGLPQRSVLDLERDAFIAFSTEHVALVERLRTNYDAVLDLMDHLTPRVGLEGATVGDAQTPAEYERLKELAAERMALCEALGEPLTLVLTEDGDVWIAEPS